MSAPTSWCLPGGPGILTLRDQLVADEREHFRQSLANKTHLRAPRSGAQAMWSEEPGFSIRTWGQVPELPLSSCVPLGIPSATVGFRFFSWGVGAAGCREGEARTGRRHTRSPACRERWRVRKWWLHHGRGFLPGLHSSQEAWVLALSEERVYQTGWNKVSSQHASACGTAFPRSPAETG